MSKDIGRQTRGG